MMSVFVICLMLWKHSIMLNSLLTRIVKRSQTSGYDVEFLRDPFWNSSFGPVNDGFGSKSEELCC